MILLQLLARILGVLIIVFAIFQISEFGEAFLENQFGLEINNQSVRNALNLNDQLESSDEVSIDTNDRPLFSIIDVPSLIFISSLLLGFTLLSVELVSIFQIIRMGIFVSPYAIDKNTQLLIKGIKNISDDYYSKGASALKSSTRISKKLPVWPLLIEQMELKLPFEDIVQILGNDAALNRKTFDRLTKIVNNISNVSPSLGVIGTVLGLIKLLFNLQDPSNLGPSMALALMTTFYGLLFSVMIFKPLVMRLESNKMSLMNSYQHAAFWISIIESKKPSFYLEQKYS